MRVTMPGRSPLSLLLPGLLALSLCRAALAAPPDVPTPVSLKAASSALARYDLGETSLLDQPEIVHTFLLRNDGSAPLILESLVPSCHCTTAIVGTDGTLPTLAPGGQVSVQVKIVVEPYMSGPLDKWVVVYAKGTVEPVTKLEITGTLRPSVTLMPEAVDFGTVAAGQARAQTVTATFDSRLLSAGAAPNLLSSDPDVQIVPNPADEGVTPPSSLLRTFSYRVTLARDAALGPVRGLLHFAPTAGAAAASGLSLADGPAVPLTGEVAGAATAQPSLLAFGVVRRGRPGIGHITLSAQNATVWESVKIASDGPWVTARLAPSSAARRTLNVTLNPDAPAGSVQSQITVLLANGQRLRVPVSAYVSTGP